MRVISGSAKGRRLFTPKDMRIRPTADRVKESLFNILGNLIGSFEGIRVLDIFAGTGSLGIETLSRGAASAVFIENHRDSVTLLSRNLHLTNFIGISRIIRKNAAAGVEALSREGQAFRLIFLDPPYEQGLAKQTLEQLGSSPLIENQTIVVAEYSVREHVGGSFGLLYETDRRMYGDTVLSLLSAE